MFPVAAAECKPRCGTGWVVSRGTGTKGLVVQSVTTLYFASALLPREGTGMVQRDTTSLA
jgi:hypothetical protein